MITSGSCRSPSQSNWHNMQKLYLGRFAFIKEYTNIGDVGCKYLARMSFYALDTINIHTKF